MRATEVDRWAIIQSAVHEHQICLAFRILRSINIEPVLLKGWSIGRWYPGSETRNSGDIDLLVRDEDFAAARNEFDKRRRMNIDWHLLSALQTEFIRPEAVIARSQTVPLEDTEIRVLCPEDNLHFVAIHMLRHGGWSPVWVRDVAVLLECRPAEFDWNICMGSDPVRAGWVLSALVLAHRLAGANISGTPAEKHRIPPWVESTVRRAQKRPEAADNQPAESIWVALAHPWRLPHGIRKRWPNPVAAAITTGVPFESRSPFAHQLAYCGHLVGGFFSRLSRTLRQNWLGQNVLASKA